jgi:hypothetical protein
MMLKDYEIGLSGEGQYDLWVKLIGHKDGDKLRMPWYAKIEFEKKIEKMIIREKSYVLSYIGRDIGAWQERPQNDFRSRPVYFSGEKRRPGAGLAHITDGSNVPCQDEAVIFLLKIGD